MTAHPHDEALSAAALWDARYAESHRIWSGNPNATLVREAADLAPGRALDIGCGEGGDAIWLAERGWTVTGIDVSRIALARAAEHAREKGVGDRIEWEWHDLGATFPTGGFDLVSAHFLHSHGDLPREAILRSAAAAVLPGGVLLIVGHSGLPAWEENPHPEMELPTPASVLAALELPDGAWEVLRCEEHERIQNDPDGKPTTRIDNTLKVRRISA
ncbi:SAM-dependent methyltransferase [Embleya sp. AB8]|uniref:SAM-dependent methyltransferase n=1 Tax=Embleya sp. AB8 TaxID=3156304 RepID=UPI003C781D93